MIIFLLFYPIYTITLEGYIIKMPWSKYHGLPKRSNYGPKPLIPYKNSALLQNGGASTHPEALTPHGIFTSSNCAPLCVTLCTPLHAPLRVLPHKMQSLFQNLGHVGLHPTSPQHSHVTRRKSLNRFSFVLCCNVVVGTMTAAKCL